MRFGNRTARDVAEAPPAMLPARLRRCEGAEGVLAVDGRPGPPLVCNRSPADAAIRARLSVISWRIGVAHHPDGGQATKLCGCVPNVPQMPSLTWCSTVRLQLILYTH